MALILAIDQGATKTAALVADRTGRIHGVGYGPGACHASDGMAAAMNAVRAAAESALGQAGASLAQVDQVCGGLTGADWPYEYPLLAAALQETLGVQAPLVVNDCIIAWRAGTDSPFGAVLCAGTGLNAAVTSPRGESYIYGYYVNGDDNGGTALGILSLRAVFRAEAGTAPPTRLTQALLDHFHLPDVDELLRQHVAGRLGPPSALVPILVAAMAAGDAVANELVTSFGERLAGYVVAGLKRFDMLQLPQDVVLSGGIFKAGLPGLRATVKAAIQREAPGAAVVDARYEPVVGALLLALDQLGGRRTSVAGSVVAESAGKHQLIRMCS